jgi:hypothetical protein
MVKMVTNLEQMNKDMGLDRLLAITSGCRTDMHEPDEQGLKAMVVGDHLDNACGHYIGVEQIVGGFQEFVVILKRFDEKEGWQTESFNLANLIALARQA